MREVLNQLLAKQNLSFDQAMDTMHRIMSGEFNDIQISGFLVALRAKGESSSEIAGFAQAMREKMVRVPVTVDAIDMCGTGGDASGTFNISTAASFVVAGAGVPVAKHGNRSITSKSGSADVLTALGVDITLKPATVAKAVETIGLGFMFAPALHPAMKYVMPTRTTLGIRTVFNILGPLCNPAGVRRQVMGVFDGTLTDKLAEVLKKLNAQCAVVVHGEDGLDELTTTTSTKVTYLTENGVIKSDIINPRSMGIKHASLKSLQGGAPELNAQIIRTMLTGAKGPVRDIVVLNAAAGLMVGGKVNSIKSGLALAEESIDSGSAQEVLERLVALA